MSIFKRRGKQTIATDRHTLTGNRTSQISGYKSRTYDILKEFRGIHNVYDAIAFMVEKIPDANMAMTSMLRLANTGNTMEIYQKNGKRNIKVEYEWREFCQRINSLSNDGLDGLIDQFHKSALLFGGMACETVVLPGLEDIDDVFPILPQSIDWELDKATQTWIPYQNQNGNRVDLRKGNFCWVAFDSAVGQPTGSLMYESALQAIDYQLQFQVDLTAVLRRIGYPRNDLSIDRESILKNMPASIRNDQNRVNEYLTNHFEFIKTLMRSLEPTDDIIHFNDIQIGSSSGGSDNSRSIDLRAYNEIIDPQVLNGLSCLAVLANRTTGITESWGTVQYQIVTKTLQKLQRGSKRLVENIAQIWLRVHGYDMTAKFKHNPIDWQTELEKENVILKKMEKNRRAEEYEWIDKQTAAQNTLGITTLPDQSEKKLRTFEYIKRTFSENKTQPKDTDQLNSEGGEDD
ncbi:MAG: hypothetical protein UGF45_09945 [Massilioclostridium sp.]|nr:hypothetical protein [Massilioclostridium sp.]